MSEKKDRLSRAIEVYKAKYKMNVPQILKFVRDRIDSPAEHLAIIEEQILSHQDKNE